MRRIRMLGLMMVAVFALSATAASTASALQWLDNGNPISEPILVLSLGTLLLADLAATGGATAIVCHGVNHGTVGPKDRDLILSITAKSCAWEKTGACKATPVPTPVAVHLPWVTRLLTVNGATRDMIESSGNGTPGWSVTCSTILGEVTDECTSTTGEPKVTNNTTDVTESFEPSEQAKCSLGTSTSGMVIGDVLVFAENPLLRISTG